MNNRTKITNINAMSYTVNENKRVWRNSIQSYLYFLSNIENLKAFAAKPLIVYTFEGVLEIINTICCFKGC